MHPSRWAGRSVFIKKKKRGREDVSEDQGHVLDVRTCKFVSAPNLKGANALRAFGERLRGNTTRGNRPERF